METQCILYLDKDRSITKHLKLDAGDDATDCHWMTIDLKDPNFKLYASHKQFVELAVEKARKVMK